MKASKERPPISDHQKKDQMKDLEIDQEIGEIEAEAEEEETELDPDHVAGDTDPGHVQVVETTLVFHLTSPEDHPHHQVEQASLVLELVLMEVTRECKCCREWAGREQDWGLRSQELWNLSKVEK